MMKRILISLLSMRLLLSCASTRTTEKKSRVDLNPLSAVVRFYQGPLNHLSAVRSGECPMYPCCSRYSLQCFQKNGLFVGYVIMFDRLMRCGRDKLYLSPEIIVDGKSKCYDPVKNNDFWWYRKNDLPVGYAEKMLTCPQLPLK